MDNRKIDPDVFTVVMSLFGAVGTLATIADYVRGGRHQRQETDRRRRENNKKLLELSVRIEAATNNLQVDFELVRSILWHNAPLLPASESGPVSQEPLQSPFLLGGLKLILPKGDFREFSAAHQRIATDCRALLKDVYALVQLMHEYQVGISEQSYDRLVKLQAGINRVFMERLTYIEAMTVISEIMQFASDTCRQVKQDFLPSPAGDPNAMRRYG
jgi:hypothetical protein